MSGSNLRNNLLSKGIGRPPVHPPGSHLKGRFTRDYTPLDWTGYFEDSFFIENSQGDKFNVYTSGQETDPTVVFLHGGGHSGLTWAVACRELTKLISIRCVAIDFRGHGRTQCSDQLNLSTEQLVEDTIMIYEKLQADQRPIVLVGHSMGGAAAVHTAFTVEGSAMDALAGMQQFLRGRPSRFDSVEKAIEWIVRTGQIRNLESARVSMPSQLKPASADGLSGRSADPAGSAVLQEADEDDEEALEVSASTAKIKQDEPTKSADGKTAEMTWRINLTETECHWNGWFKDLTSHFLGVACPKLLLLAGIDRLDRDMTVAQMQGKFQMNVMDRSGHCVHEDQPEKFAALLATFLIRHKVVSAKEGFAPLVPGC